MSEESNEVCIDIQNKTDNNTIQTSSALSMNLENSAIITSLLPFLTVQDIDHLSRTNSHILKTVVDCNDWEKCVSDLFYPNGFNQIHHKKSIDVMNNQITDYQKRKQEASSIYNAYNKYRPLFSKNRRLSNVLLVLSLFLFLACIFFLIVHIFEVSFALTGEVQIFLTIHYIPISLIIHLVCLYILFFLSYYISNAISVDFEKDVFFYHLGYALIFPKIMYKCLPVYDHVGFTLLFYTFSHVIWYAGYLGYLVFSTVCYLYAFAALLYHGCTYRYRKYLNKIQKEKKGAEQKKWKEYLKESESYFMICYLFSLLVTAISLIHAVYFELGGFFWIIYPSVFLIFAGYYLIGLDSCNDWILYLSICFPFVVTPILLYVCYTVQYNCWSWLAGFLCLIFLFLWGFLIDGCKHEYKLYHKCVDRKRLMHYICLNMNKVSEADVIKEYCNHLGFEDVTDIDYSSTNDYLFKIALERALEKNNSTHINEPEPSTTSNDSFTESSESDVEEQRGQQGRQQRGQQRGQQRPTEQPRIIIHSNNSSSTSLTDDSSSSSTVNDGEYIPTPIPPPGEYLDEDRNEFSQDILNSPEFLAFQMAMLMSFQENQNIGGVNQQPQDDGPVIEEVFDNSDHFSVD